MRLNFVNLPHNDFELKKSLFDQLDKECKIGSVHVSTIQKILIEMEHFLGIFGKDQSIIFMEKINDDMAGYIEKRDFILNEMTIGFNDIYSPYNYLSVLAHEVSHEFQFFNHKEHLFKDLMEAEEFTDDLTFYLGFGIYTEKGKIATKITE